MKKRSVGKRLLTGAACVGITTTMFASTVFASPVGKTQLNAIGGDSAITGNNKVKKSDNQVIAPLAAAAVISQVAQPSVTPIAAAAVDTSAMAEADAAEAQAVETQETEAQTAETTAPEEAQAAEAETAEAVEETSPYENVALSQVNNYVNVRVEPNTEAEVVGKLYNNAAATILETVEQEDGTWYRIESGSVTGYIKSDYFVTGSDLEAIAQDVGHVTATVNTQTLRLRSEATTDSSIVDLLPEGDTYAVEEQGDEFTKIVTDSGKEGYVHNDYIEVEVNFDQAISLEEERRQQEEEAARQAAEEAARQEAAEEAARQEAAEEAAREEAAEEAARQEAAEEAAREEAAEEESYEEASSDESYQEDTSSEEEQSNQEDTSYQEEQQETEAAEDTSSEEDNSYSSNSELRSSIVDYALSFVGNLDYVYGGTSLTSGVDCSGFVQQIFAAYGVSLPRTSGSQGSTGRSISYDEIQPGDLVHYSGHIAIYIGNGQVVHASSPSTGVKISTWNYRSVESIRNVLD